MLILKQHNQNTAYQHLARTEGIWGISNDSYTHVDHIHETESVWVILITKILKLKAQTSYLNKKTKKKLFWIPFLSYIQENK